MCASQTGGALLPCGTVTRAHLILPQSRPLWLQCWRILRPIVSPHRQLAPPPLPALPHPLPAAALALPPGTPVLELRQAAAWLVLLQAATWLVQARALLRAAVPGTRQSSRRCIPPGHRCYCLATHRSVHSSDERSPSVHHPVPSVGPPYTRSSTPHRSTSLPRTCSCSVGGTGPQSPGLSASSLQAHNRGWWVSVTSRKRAYQKNMG